MALISILASALLVVPPPVIPVHGTVIAPFRAPACERCAGHRGVTVATAPGSPVRAVRAGPLTFVGEVAGLLYVVQEVGTGVRVTYGWLASTADVVKGQEVEAGSVLGYSAARTYLGVRIGQIYTDPLRYLGFARPRLIGPGRAIGGRRNHFR